MKIEYFEESNGNLIKALVSEEKFDTITFVPKECTDNEVTLYALVLTEEIEAAIKQYLGVGL